jgi:N-methylhydantoinase B
MPSKMPYEATAKGDTFIVVGPAGGGYGDPKKRDPERVLADVLDGFVSIDDAREQYGVSIGQDMTVDRAATAALRGRADSR